MTLQHENARKIEFVIERLGFGPPRETHRLPAGTTVRDADLWAQACQRRHRGTLVYAVPYDDGSMEMLVFDAPEHLVVEPEEAARGKRAIYAQELRQCE